MPKYLVVIDLVVEAESEGDAEELVNLNIGWDTLADWTRSSYIQSVTDTKDVEDYFDEDEDEDAIDTPCGTFTQEQFDLHITVCDGCCILAAEGRIVQ